MKKIFFLFAFAVLCCSATKQVWAEDTGWLRATNYNNIGVFAPQWVLKPYVEDHETASFDFSSNSSIEFGGFGISIPEGKRITGIEVQLIGSANPNNLTLNLSWNNGSDFTNTSYHSNFSSNYTLSTENFGGPADNWGKSGWSATELSNGNFLVRLTLAEGSVPGSTDLDFIAVKVYYQSTTSPITFLSNGTFVVPEGVTEVTVQAWGAGGKGGRTFSQTVACGGGGGGAYASSTMEVSPGAAYPVHVGIGTEYLTLYGDVDTWFGSTTTLFAKGGYNGSNGPAGDGGSAAESIGDVKFSGGNGASGNSDEDEVGNLLLIYSGGGGSSAGTTVNGNSTSNYLGASGPADGGSGGNGVQWTGTSSDGNAGSFPGGGGGGAISNGGSFIGGDGGGGQVIVSWESTPCPGSAVAVENETGVTNSGNSLGEPDGNVAILTLDDNGQLTLDLTGEAGNIAPGNTITILWKKNSEVGPLVDVETQNEITGSWETVAKEYQVTNVNLTGYSFPVTADARYLAILVDGYGGEILEIDAVTYTCSCTAPTPTVSVENYCGYSVLTASNCTGELTWSNGETGSSIKVYNGGIYSVSQKVGECLSLSGSGRAEPYVIPGTPGTISGPAQPCEGTDVVYSINSVSGDPNYIWSVPDGWTITAGENTVSITVNVGTNSGNVTVKATNVNCESANESVKSVTPDLICCTPGQPDRFEDNNTLQTATLINVGDPVIYANILDSKDADWFYFVTGEAGSYTLNYIPGSTAETMALYNSSARKLKPTDRTGTTYSLLANTTYYIKVSAKLRSPAPCYSLGVEYGSAGLFVMEQFDELKSAQITPTPDGAFKIWPNPTKNEFELYNGNETPVQVRVMDVIGRTIETIENVRIAQTIVFGSKYKPGIYFVQTFENYTPKVFKLVKQ
jgi:hypothetical protein